MLKTERIHPPKTVTPIQSAHEHLAKTERCRSTFRWQSDLARKSVHLKSVLASSFCQHAFRLNDYSLHWWWNHTIMTRSALSSKASVALSCFSFIWDALIRWERKGGERYFAGKGEIIRRRRPTRRKKLYFCMALRVCGKTEHCRCSIGIQTSRGYQRNWCLHLKTNE